MRPHDGRVEHLNQVRGAAGCGKRVEEGFEHACLAEAPEALPHRVPVAECLRQSAPGDVVDGEVVQRFEEPAVVPTLVAPPPAAGAEYLHHHFQSSSVIRVSMVGLLKPTDQVSRIHERGNPLTAYSTQSVHTP